MTFRKSIDSQVPEFMIKGSLQSFRIGMSLPVHIDFCLTIIAIAVDIRIRELRFRGNSFDEFESFAQFFYFYAHGFHLPRGSAKNILHARFLVCGWTRSPCL